MIFLLPLAFAVTPDASDSLLNADDARARVRLHAELGFLAPLKHTIQFDTQGTTFNYLKEGGQDNLFLFTRLSADLDIGERNTVILLAQPLDLRTETIMERDVTEAKVTFPEGTPVDLRYGFTFYRGSWLSDLAKSEEKEVALGASLQIRNAAISFASQDGTLYTIERDIGPVPLIKFRTRHPLGASGYTGVEIDAMYAPIKYLNGSDVDVVGSLLDFSWRVGLERNNGTDWFLNARYLTGGAEGTSQNPDGLGDGYTENWLHFMSVSMGATLR